MRKITSIASSRVSSLMAMGSRDDHRATRGSTTSAMSAPATGGQAAGGEGTIQRTPHPAMGIAVDAEQRLPDDLPAVPKEADGRRLPVSKHGERVLADGGEDPFPGDDVEPKERTEAVSLFAEPRQIDHHGRHVTEAGHPARRDGKPVPIAEPQPPRGAQAEVAQPIHRSNVGHPSSGERAFRDEAPRSGHHLDALRGRLARSARLATIAR